MMTEQELRELAWLGDAYVKGAIRGVVLVFHGLGYTQMRRAPEPEELCWAREGALVVFPYYGPWSWMNRQARALVDNLVDAVYAQFALAGSIPLIATGGSMGGLSALIYTRYARRPVAACLATYPVCDLAYHEHERPDLPRTLRHAFGAYSEPWETLLAEHSPIEQAPHMPAIPYLLIHGDADRAVDKARHSDRFVAALRVCGLPVSYLEVPDMGHGDPGPGAVYDAKITFVTQALRAVQSQPN
jgi:dipeptidyl aminopeptidase/acylaminoacyl peptidase